MKFTTTSINFSISPYTEGRELPVIKPNLAFLSDIGEQGMRDLLHRFYMNLFESPIKEIFPAEREVMEKAGQISADFFIQVCGGTPYFNQNRGAPQMRKRHAPFKITAEGRLHWLIAYEEALAHIIQNNLSTEENIQSFWNYLDSFSQWMINARD